MRLTGMSALRMRVIGLEKVIFFLLWVLILHVRWVNRDTLIGLCSAIYPIVGILCEGHKDQLLALLTFLKEECQLKAMAAFSKCGSKVRRELKNLECSINYNYTGEWSIRGKGKVRAHPMFL